MSEFPKMLYSGETKEPVTRIVNDSDEQHSAEAEGFKESSVFFGLVADAALAPAMNEIGEQREMIAMLEAENADLRAKLAAFDGDGDGRPGGSKPKPKPAA